jgi:hypothetical protein
VSTQAAAGWLHAEVAIGHEINNTSARLHAAIEQHRSDNASGAISVSTAADILVAAERALEAARSLYLQARNLPPPRLGPGAAEMHRPEQPITQIPDASDTDLRPDPRSARTPGQLMEMLRDRRTWAGNPSYREMASVAGSRSAPSTIWKALTSDELPRYDIYVTLLVACGASRQEMSRYVTAWRRLQGLRPPQHSADMPSLRSVDSALQVGY